MKALNLIMAVLFAIMPVMASTTIRTQLSSSGATSYNDYSSVSGYDWSERSWQVTATHQLAVDNYGELNFVQNHDSPGAWMLHESFQAYGSGDTFITKDVNWWTEDSTLTNGGTEMKWPTEANVYTWFQTDEVLDVTELHNVADMPVEYPTGEFSHGRFLRNYETSDDFNFVESTGFGMDLDCDVTPPQPVAPPACEEFCWQ